MMSNRQRWLTEVSWFPSSHTHKSSCKCQILPVFYSLGLTRPEHQEVAVNRALVQPVNV